MLATLATAFLLQFSAHSQPCFYQLLHYELSYSSNWYNISFYNNSATKGGNHIYGAFMHSGICPIAVADPINTELSCCVQKFFHYGPKSISPVSSDPVRVCLCEHGSQRCNESRIHIEVYPGDTLTIPVLVYSWSRFWCNRW